MTDPIRSPVVVDGLVSGEKLSQLLALEAEYPELDFKHAVDLSEKRDEIELTKDIGAMRVRGGYIVLGVDGKGDQSDGMDEVELRSFDEANLKPKMLRYLADVDLRVGVFERGGHPLVLICVLPSPFGCTFFRSDGSYLDGERPATVFRKGDVFWRDGTRSVRMSSQGLEEVIEARVAKAKEGWLDEQHAIRRREAELDEVDGAGAGGEDERRGDEPRVPLDRLNLEIPPAELAAIVLELARYEDDVAFAHLLIEAVARAKALIEAGDIESGLVDLLDLVTCLAASLLTHGREDWFERLVGTLVAIYSLPFAEGDVQRFGYSTHIDPTEAAPRVWLAVIEHVFALGALAMRREAWRAVRTLTLQLPLPLAENGYDRNWLRHALTMASRADHLQEEQEDGRRNSISLLSLARNVVAKLDCLRPDGIGADDEAIFTSLAQFDLLSNLVAIDDVQEARGRVFYPNFARFRQERVQPIADRLVAESALRDALLKGGDAVLAEALATVGERAANEGWQFDGFFGWDGTPVASFIAEHT